MKINKKVNIIDNKSERCFSIVASKIFSCEEYKNKSYKEGFIINNGCFYEHCWIEDTDSKEIFELVEDNNNIDYNNYVPYYSLYYAKFLFKNFVYNLRYLDNNDVKYGRDIILKKLIDKGLKYVGTYPLKSIYKFKFFNLNLNENKLELYDRNINLVDNNLDLYKTIKPYNQKLFELLPHMEDNKKYLISYNTLMSYDSKSNELVFEYKENLFTLIENPTHILRHNNKDFIQFTSFNEISIFIGLDFYNEMKNQNDLTQLKNLDYEMQKNFFIGRWLDFKGNFPNFIVTSRNNKLDIWGEQIKNNLFLY